MASGAVRVQFPPVQQAAARRVLDSFVPTRREAATWLGVAVPETGLIHLVESHAALRALAPGAPEWAVGVCRRDGTIVIRVDRLDTSPETTLRSVLAHEILHHVVAHHGGMPVPRWFEEGLCVVFAGGSFLRVGTRVERLAAMDRLPTLEEAERGFRGSAADAARAYEVGASAVRRMMKQHGLQSVQRLLRETKRGAPFQAAFLRATGQRAAEFQADWREAVTPGIPWWLFVLWERLDWALLAFGAVLVAGAYVRWRLRRERAMQSLETPETQVLVPPPPPTPDSSMSDPLGSDPCGPDSASQDS